MRDRKCLIWAGIFFLSLFLVGAARAEDKRFLTLMLTIPQEEYQQKASILLPSQEQYQELAVAAIPKHASWDGYLPIKKEVPFASFEKVYRETREYFCSLATGDTFEVWFQGNLGGEIGIASASTNSGIKAVIKCN